MTAAKRFFGTHRIFFCLFVFVTVYMFTVGNHLQGWKVSEHFLAFYAVDFSLGFCSRFLPGAVYRVLFGNVDPVAVSVISVVLLVLFFAGLCAVLERLICSCDQEHRPLCLFFVLLFVTGPAAFSLFTQWLGVIDVYWIFLCLLFVVLLRTRRGYYLIPAVGVGLVFVHYGALICYVPMMAVLLLYRIAHTDEKKEHNALWTVLLLFAAASALLTGYFILFERKNLPYTMEEFNAILHARGAPYTYYYDYNIYRNMSSAGDMSVEAYIYGSGNPFVTFLRSVWMQIKMTVFLHLRNGFPRDYVLSLLAVSPVVGAVTAVFFARFRDPENRGFLKKAVYLLQPLLFFASLILSALFSSDTYRWLTHCFLALMTVFLMVAAYEGDRFWETVRGKLSVFQTPVLSVFLCFYAAAVPLVEG